MLKGINRQVIEINSTDCEYFEKVMFFVKPEFVNLSEGKLRERANAIACGAGKPPATKIHRNRLRFLGAITAAAGSGAAIMAAVAAFVM